ncbi:hypothetical protein VSDG_02664 [Cytospora chrysosperma]|uniref:Reticulon-like protein n=1 Tax=Cytospora chrysosperma TaxID=252740 RepID=A0A423WCP7_CYTCH|nr:hypothetical protein VSDG_02664 [Valsa sordida]
MADTFNSVTNGPVADKVKEQHQKTSNEFSNLAASRQVPNNPAATGQPLTHYHSFFSELLSWNNPRASAIAYASTIAFIFAVRYLDLLRWGFKLTWMVLGVTVAAEVAGKTVMNTGLASQLRPRRYYTVPRETLDTVIGDVHELVNFLVIEAQRIVFAENIWASVTVCLSAFLSYWLVKIVPYWGLALLATTLIFTVPLVYISNQELIDHHLKNAQELVNAQTEQLRKATATHTAHATEATKQLMGDYTSKAQQMLRGRSTSPEVARAQPAVRESDFPAAPQEDFQRHEESAPAMHSEPEPAFKHEAEQEPLYAA